MLIGRVVIVVNSDCSIPENPSVFAIGDIAAFKGPGGKLLPGVSRVAMQQGRHVAEAILGRLRGAQPTAFTYYDKGSMATIGRSRAVVEVWGMQLRGFFAWLTWLFVHLWFLVGFKNRVFVLLQWVFSYVFYRRGARLITHVDHEKDVRIRARYQKRISEDLLPKSALQDKILDEQRSSSLLNKQKLHDHWS